MPHFLDLCDLCGDGVYSDGRCCNCGSPAPVIGGQGKSVCVGDALAVLASAVGAVLACAAFVAMAK